MSKERYRYSWAHKCWRNVRDIEAHNRWFDDGCPVRIEIDGRGTFYRAGDPPVLYPVNPRSVVRH